MLNVIMLSVLMLNVVMQSVLMLNVVMLSVIMLNVLMLNVVMLSVVMLSVLVLNVVAPFSPPSATNLKKSFQRLTLGQDVGAELGRLHGGGVEVPGAPSDHPILRPML